MRSLYLLIVTVVLACVIQAQPEPAAETAVPGSAPSPKESTSIARAEKKSKLVIPPEKARPITIPRTDVGLVIDGKVDEEAWKQAAVFKDFYQTSPGDNTEASKPTEVYMMYDETHLYIAFKCWDERDKIRATVAKRDSVFGEDNVRVWLDTYNDQRRAYILGFNPLGIQQDGIYTEGRGADFSVDIVMESKGVIEEWGWSVEVKIPFKSLRYASGKGKFWGFNAARNIDRLNDEFDQWLPDDRNVSGFLIKHGRITGLDDIKYERTLELVPSITISETGTRKRTLPISTVGQSGYDPIFNPIGLQDPGRFVNDPAKPEFGLNLKYTISPNKTLDAAINPDYAEIEADAPVVTANQRFPIFFEEKRPFFLEGKEIFDSPLQLFYSRTIVDPDVAVKLTGKTGKTTYGFLAASDNAPGNYSDDERTDPFIGSRISEFVDKNATFGVLRLKRDIGKEDNIGFFATARMFPKNRNFAAGFDGTLKINPKTVMKYQLLGTHSRKFFYSPQENRTNYRTGNGLGYYVNVDYTTDRHGFFIEATGRTKDYRADAGFTRRTNTNRFFFANRFSTKSRPSAAIIRANFNQFARYSVDFYGRTQEALVGGNVNLTFQGNLFVYAEAGVSREQIYEDEFGPMRNVSQGQRGAFHGAPFRKATGPYFSVNFNKSLNKRLSVFGFLGSITKAIDYDFGGGPRYPRSSPAFESYIASPDFNEYIDLLYQHRADPKNVPRPNLPQPPALDPGTGWQFDAEIGAEYKPIDPLRISASYRKSRLTRDDNGNVAFDANIFTLRSTYQFTRFAFVRTRWDYDSLQSGANGQFLFGWNPNPGTAFYVGYNDSFNYNGFNPYTGQFEPRFERNSRTFFIRASYLFRKSF